MNVSLTSNLEKYVNAKVKSGRYYSASEVIREGLRLLQDQDAMREGRLKELQQKIDRGMAQLDRGEGIPGPIAKAELKRYSAEHRKRP